MDRVDRIGLVGVGGPTMAQQGAGCLPSGDFQRVARYWKGAYADSLLAMAGPSVQVEWGERQSTYPNKAAYAVLRNFMNKHPLRSYRTLHARCEQGAGAAYLWANTVTRMVRFSKSVYFGNYKTTNGKFIASSFAESS